jgi:integrase
VLALDSGARLGEILALEWTDLDWDTGTLSITKTASLQNGTYTIKETKTRAGLRRIRLTHQTLAVLAELRRKAPRRARLIFPDRNGKIINRPILHKALYRTLDRAGLPRIRFHDLRHSHATLSLLKTKNIKAVSARLGHEDIQVTLQTYAHWLPAMEEEILSAWEDILTAPPAAPRSRPPSAQQHSGEALRVKL